ncbi:MAG: hypothetical protein J6L86_07895, partial [Alphaproteobacteria bacterium]|nr:hypothetical protein [Alphaproteobacteria bacterium]
SCPVLSCPSLSFPLLPFSYLPFCSPLFLRLFSTPCFRLFSGLSFDVVFFFLFSGFDFFIELGFLLSYFCLIKSKQKSSPTSFSKLSAQS